GRWVAGLALVIGSSWRRHEDNQAGRAHGEMLRTRVEERTSNNRAERDHPSTLPVVSRSRDSPRTPARLVERSPPASFKRWLGGLGRTIEHVYHTRPQTVLGSDDQQPVVLNQPL